MTMTHREAQDIIQTARNRAAGKPIQRNTRLYGEVGKEFKVKYHNTFVVIIHTDGTYTLNSGGYRTNSTMDRIHTYSPAGKNWSLHSERGDWYVRMKPVDRDPRPAVVERSIPRPFTPGDHMGDEPVKTTEGCQAGQMVTTEHVGEPVEIWRKDMLEHDVIQEVLSHGHDAEGKYDRVTVKRTWTDHVYYSEQQHWDEEWNKIPGVTPHRNHFTNQLGEEVKRIQCPHCAEFDAIHERWSRWYNGGSQWHSIDQRKGYKLYEEMMNRFHNDKDLWQEAYIADFRARRAYLKADREWVNRNRVPFFDGIVIDSEGYASRVREKGAPSPAKLRRFEKEAERMKKKINKYVDGYIKALIKGMPMPGTGDCWFCALRTDSQPLGDLADNHEHLLSHMEERYYVPSLAVNALRERGLKDLGISLVLDMTENGMGGRVYGNKTYADVRRYLTAYMRKRLMPQAPTS